MLGYIVDIVLLATIAGLLLLGVVTILRLARPGFMVLIGRGGQPSKDCSLRDRHRGLSWLVYVLGIGAPFPFIVWISVAIVTHNIMDVLPYAVAFAGAEVGLAILLRATILDRPFHWDCEHCGKRISSHSPWVCGFCDKEHLSPAYHCSVLRRCCECEAPPPAFLCPHCDKPTQLLPEGDVRHPARPIPKPLPGETPEAAGERRTREIAERKHEIERLEHEAKIKKLEAELKRYGPPSKADPKVERERWLRDQLEALNLNVELMARSLETGRLAVKRIEENPNYTEEEKKELMDYIIDECKDFNEEIRRGRHG